MSSTPVLKEDCNKKMDMQDDKNDNSDLQNRKQPQNGKIEVAE